MRVSAAIGDEDYRAFRGTTMGSHRWVTVTPSSDLDDALTPLETQGLQTVAAHLDENAVDYREIDYTLPTAIVMGAERAGLSAQARQRVDHCVTIPMVGMVGSFNVSVAAGIILAEAQQQRQRAGLYDHRRIDDKTYQRLFFQWAHPRLRAFCEERGLRYPELDGEGELADAPGWYAQVRAGTAPRYVPAQENSFK
jgi:tRNA (guanosine-2'-O-)-methyltransferase